MSNCVHGKLYYAVYKKKKVKSEVRFSFLKEGSTVEIFNHIPESEREREGFEHDIQKLLTSLQKI